MQIVQLLDDSLVFNWDQLPENIQVNTQLRDKLFQEVKTKWPLTQFIDVKVVFQINKYLIERIKSELKPRTIDLKT
jgi:hypothetical protein